MIQAPHFHADGGYHCSRGGVCLRYHCIAYIISNLIRLYVQWFQLSTNEGKGTDQVKITSKIKNSYAKLAELFLTIIHINRLESETKVAGKIVFFL